MPPQGAAERLRVLPRVQKTVYAGGASGKVNVPRVGMAEAEIACEACHVDKAKAVRRPGADAASPATARTSTGPWPRIRKRPSAAAWPPQGGPAPGLPQPAGRVGFGRRTPGRGAPPPGRVRRQRRCPQRPLLCLGPGRSGGRSPGRKRAGPGPAPSPLEEAGAADVWIVFVYSKPIVFLFLSLTSLPGSPKMKLTTEKEIP